MPRWKIGKHDGCSCYHSMPALHAKLPWQKGIQTLGGPLFLGPGRREGIVCGVASHAFLSAPHYCLHITDKVWAKP
jgi:hypothetical protein